jgi:hypothetical protein
MYVHPKLRFALAFLTVALSICSLIAVNSLTPSQAAPQLTEQFDPKLMSVSSVSEAVDYVRISAEGGTDKQLLQAADQFVRRRFRHGYSSFSPADDWLAYTAGYAWSDLRNPVIPDDILKYSEAACSQQAIVFQAIAHRLGFSVGSVGFPGHFASAVKVQGHWIYFDPNKEISAANVPLSEVLSGSRLPALYGDEGRDWQKAAERGEIKLRHVDSNPAPQATFLHNFTRVFSGYGWLILTVLLVLTITSQAPVRLPAGERLFSTRRLRLPSILQICCLVFGHLRNRRRARFAAGTWNSHCRLCETPMIRLGKGHWIPTAQLRLHAGALLGSGAEIAWTVEEPSFSEIIGKIEEQADANLRTLRTYPRSISPNFKEFPRRLIGLPREDDDRKTA